MNIQSEAWQGEPSLLLSGGGYSARILPRFGANCVSLRHESGAVLLREQKDPQTLAAAPNVYGLPLLFPPNRIRDGHFSFGGRSYDFPINEPARHHHLHGLLSTTPFSCEGGAAFTFRADAEHPYLSFPHAFTVTRAFALDEGGLVQTLTVRNDSALPMPLGTGFHAAWSVPLFSGQSPLDCRLHIPVRRHWLHDPQTIIPTGETVTDSPLLRALREAFGDVIFRQDGSVDVHAIGLIVFKDRKKLAELDAIVHERIPRALAQKMAATNAEIIGLDAIKLIESGLGAICDATVAVTAPEEVRVKRIMARDSITEEYARSRIAAQKDADYFRAQCDYEFVNDLPTAEKAEHAAEVYINTIINNLKEETER